MKQFLSIFILFFFFTTSVCAQRTIGGTISATPLTVQKEEAAAGMGLEHIYIFKTLSGATVSFETENYPVKVYTYQNSIGDKTEVIPKIIGVVSAGGKMYTVPNLQDNKGLVFEDSRGGTKSVWIVDYSTHRPVLSSITPVEAADKCEMLKLLVDKNDLLEYRGTSGQVREITRKYDIVYDIMEWNKEEKKFIEKEYKIEGQNIGTEILLDKVPNMDTEFTIRGDQFGLDFSDVSEAISEPYKAVSVEPYIEAVEVERDIANELKVDADKPGRSAPVDFDFFGYANKPVAQYYTWFVYDKKNMNNPIARYSDEDMSYTFEQAGNYEVVLEVASSESTCVQTVSESFEISESFLDAPNFFTPRTSPGQNDEFRVVYKSLVKFKITIVNRWGNKVYESRDPARGWDGRYGGKLVNPGVYFYRIEATGSDGIKYNKAGDINIL